MPEAVRNLPALLRCRSEPKVLVTELFVQFKARCRMATVEQTFNDGEFKCEILRFAALFFWELRLIHKPSTASTLDRPPAAKRKTSLRETEEWSSGILLL
ncbi:hypothetical protein DTW90_21840 [Neorhizobium sp. P12A]|nr:hypothetical protein DTW90_21840 [Neorhizobium sp. P12A]